MELKINHTKMIFDDAQMSVQMLLDLLCPMHQQGIAVAIGTWVIARTEWSTTMLTDQDELLMITASQGG